MLTEHFIASIGVPEKPAPAGAAKDAAIFLHEAQPILAQRAIFKKSATPPNCLATSTTHIFAAQSGRAVVHVYDREKGNQEATVPFTERISCLTLACDDTVLVLGTAEGRCFLWETATGRLITTAQSHLQAVTAVRVDPTNNFLLSASEDSTVHIWSIPRLLSFSNSGIDPPAPSRTFTAHRAGVVDLVLGHSSGFNNVAVTTAKDKSCLVWDYQSNTVLRTYLLPAIPKCVTLDPADRAIYIGYDDGSVQQLDLYAASESLSLQPVQDVTISAPLQLSSSSRWTPSDISIGPSLAIALSFDGCTLLSGHQSGAISAWDVTTGRPARSVIQNPLPGPVENLQFLSVTGFANETWRKLRIPSVVKPKFGAFDNSDGTVPGAYALNIQLSGDLQSAPSAFEQALAAPCFPQVLVDEGLSELVSWTQRPLAPSENGAAPEADDYMALDEPSKAQQPSPNEEVAVLKKQLHALRKLQSASFDKIEKLHSENRAILQREQKRLSKAGGAQTNGAVQSDISSEDD
ncbi:hypothetical protein B0A50_06487 [Salinomyces thailandicus]|uniref:Pre-rRNA-processing protein IPI3 n=1 Tax=Salinomyces thailandicus TaxID=706561 RepID=A0A4U0TNP7_9PEZI|nr:hypothetical protein B0A50_06487 [Salinomyces thailandica]